ncbi:MAG: glycosyltransferase family 2 protein [Peptoniphilaceae bacterium]|uniref:glycosyltransferase family 2 protein n=1 Tax=Parvimonas sp. TaxID=1944660 RepID=UPI0025CC4234|nr:glycosyltransferase family 2 protein [Parvimonas sp.]MCI5997240.1 glycosyltransferase family 2 protein [Parvimonas sp.]MDD7764364.1 glycosyltransferase family 2 protein [Peptoniphilaceae bacterium]MDY3050050.1 glycosyltransferase family 2 protein [Parvimonas sp.]
MKISIGVVALNEELMLPNLLEDIKNQTYPHDKIEILLVDGLSNDKTKEIMQEFKRNNDFYSVKIFDNEKKIQSAGWNIVIKNFSTEALVRIDAHASIPSDFIKKNVDVLKNGEYVSGGRRPNIIDEDTAYKKMLLEAESSMFGSGVAPFRNTSGKKYVKSMFHAMYKREVLEKVGFFNEKLLRTEDNEFHYRIRKCGYKLCYNDDIVSYQHTRNSLPKMMKQKKANGMWIGLTSSVCPDCLNLYHYVPFCFLISLIVSLISLLFTKYLFALVFGSYMIVNLLMAITSIFKGKFNIYNLMLPIVFFLLHISYGFGTLIGFLKIPSFLKNYKEV